MKFGWKQYGKVSVVPPVNTVAPVASGTAIVGQTLSVTDGTWTGTAPITYTYQWKRNNVDIGGATNATYVLQAADLGKSIKCTVTASNAAPTSGTADSNAFIIGDQYLANFGAALPNAGSSLVRVVALGDSITGRFNATNPLTEGYDVKLRDYYAAKYPMAASTDAFYPLYVRSASILTQLDSYWTLTDNGIVVGSEPNGPQGCQRFIDNRGTCTITATGRYFNFFHLLSSFGNTTGTNRAYYTIDGGSPVYFDSYAASYTQSILSVDMGTNASHTIVFTAPISGKYFCPWGIEVLSSLTGLVFWNCGYSGRVVSQFKSGDANNWISSAQPKLVICPCNTNDASAGTAAGTFNTELTNIATQVKLVGDFYIVGENLRSGADVYQEGTLYPEQQSVATAKSATLINIPDFTDWDSLANQASSGNCIDGVHPTTQGHAGYATIIESIMPY